MAHQHQTPAVGCSRRPVRLWRSWAHASGPAPAIESPIAFSSTAWRWRGSAAEAPSASRSSPRRRSGCASVHERVRPERATLPCFPSQPRGPSGSARREGRRPAPVSLGLASSPVCVGHVLVSQEDVIAFEAPTDSFQDFPVKFIVNILFATLGIFDAKWLTLISFFFFFFFYTIALGIEILSEQTVTQGKRRRAL